MTDGHNKNANPVIVALAMNDFDFSVEDVVEELKPAEMISLVASVMSEFGYENLGYDLDEDRGCLRLYIRDVKARINISNAVAPFKWNVFGKVDYFVMTSLLPKSFDMPEVRVAEMNERYPKIKFYLKKGRLAIEEAYYIRHGVGVLNLMDRICSYLTVIKTLTLEYNAFNHAADQALVLDVQV